MTPEEALAKAREAAARANDEPPVPLDASPVTRPSPEQLLEWSVIAPQMDRIYSTRRLGAPITAAKRGLAAALRQYLADAFAQESRFNMLATQRILELEERVRVLEERLARRGDG